MHKKLNTPVYWQLVEYVRAGFLALDEPVQKEIKSFIQSQQNQNGGFMDRAGQTDLYYSLFGLWLSLAIEHVDLQNGLKEFIKRKQVSESKSPVEDLALLLIKSELDPNMPKQSVFSIIKIISRKGRLIEFSYQFFLISLVIDACGKNKKLFYFFARIWLSLYKPKGNIPCSLTAALVFARKILGLNTKNMSTKLLVFSSKKSGFRAFESMENSDLLSSGVALFVLKETGFDLRMLAPGCLDFVESNYSEGAFLSGDGDLTKDLEYTFYGLLALGSLINN